MLDHVSDGRFEFGTGRGAGSHEILGFLPGMEDLTRHARDLGRRHRASSRRCGCRTSTRATRASTGRCRRARSCPSPTRSRTRRCGTPPATRRSYEMAAQQGLGVLGLLGREPRGARSPSSRRTRTTIVNAEPIGAFVNDNVMVTSAAFVAEDREEAVQSMVDERLSVPPEQRLPLPRHVPAPRRAPYWPDLIPDPTVDEVRAHDRRRRASSSATPTRRSTACQEWADAGADQLVFGRASPPQEETLETIRLIGEHVIPKIDNDPVHRTNRFRREAGAKI